MIGLAAGTGVTYHASLYLDSELIFAIVMGIVCMVPTAGFIREQLEKRSSKNYPSAIEVVALIAMLMVSLAFLANSTYNPFIYQQF